MHGRPATSPKSSRVIGGRYRLLQVAGTGGMAQVWRGEVVGSAGFRRAVAVKQIHDDLMAMPLYVDMFIEEARVGSRLQHANIAQVYDFCVEDDQCFIVLEWVEGIDLGSYLRYCKAVEMRTQWELMAAIGIAMLRALAAAHERVGDDGKPSPVVHRDVSPTNILLGVNGTVKMIDFGLALTRDRDKDLTSPGIVKGKMSYLAPEILAGKRASPATDQFAAGAVLWESLVGQKVFDGATDLEIFHKLNNGQIRPLRTLRPDVPKELAGVIARALSMQDKDRYESVRQMAHMVSAVLKTTRLRRDLLELLARTVADARSHFGLGTNRTRADETLTPVLELAGPREDGSEAEQGLWHRLPFFGRRRR